jgi:sugar phosphate isomerase/epimerase
MKISRRTLVAGGAALLAQTALPAREKLKVAIFSKHLHFLQGDEVGRAAKEIGFDGVDITVRKNGHVEPERVKQDLPPLVKAIRSHGLEVPMITTDITDADFPLAEDIVRAASELGIRYYRFGGFKYVADQPYPKQLDALKPRLAKLAAINARYQACAIYHTHSGVGLVGGSDWDLHEIMKDLDPRQVAINFDVGHATVEGGLGGWINSFHIAGLHLRGVAVKDFLWEKDSRGRWAPAWKPLGQGMVKLPEFFGLLSKTDFAGPLGGANNGLRKLTMPPAEVFAAMKRDLGQLRTYLSQASL